MSRASQRGQGVRFSYAPGSVFSVRSDLKKKLKAKSSVEVVRRGLKLLQEQPDRDFLRKAYESASHQVADALRDELDEL